jgi:uncharacterized protein YjbI with pentapeptide repeats
MAEERKRPLTREDVLKLIEENSGKAEGLDLSGANLSQRKGKADLSGLDLHGIILKGADLRGVNLSNANLQEARLEAAFLKEANLRNANLRRSNLRDAQLEEADLHGADLCEADLKRALLKGANLRAATPMEAHLVGAILREADLRDAFLMGATLANAELDEAKLQGADLECVDLSEATLWDANLYGADLGGAALRKTDFWGADLREVDFEEATFEEVEFRDARLQGAYLYAIDIPPHFRDIELEDVDWGNFILGTERIGEFKEAEVIYRHLKMWHTDRGLYGIAGEFYFRELEARRKAIWSKDYPRLPKEAPRWGKALYQLKRVRDWLGLTTVGALCGYGEKPSRVVLAAAVIIFGLAGLYAAFGSFSSGAFLNCLYYSAVSFTALGYGSWAPQPTGWVKGLGAVEAFVGVFMMALFLVTFTRKMTR